MRSRTLVVLGVVSLFLGGCAHRWEERHTGGTALGAATGASLGALIGSAAGNWGKGAVIGGGAGALTGYLIAESSRPHRRAPHRYYDAERREVVYYRDPPSAADRRQADAESWFERGVWARDDEEAGRCFRHALDLYPTPPAYNNLGLVLLRQGRREEARAMWWKALDLDPDYGPARANLDRLRG